MGPEHSNEKGGCYWGQATRETLECVIITNGETRNAHDSDTTGHGGPVGSCRVGFRLRRQQRHHRNDCEWQELQAHRFPAPRERHGGTLGSRGSSGCRQSCSGGYAGATVDAPNAQGSEPTQITQAQSELTAGACILIVAPVDSTAAAPIVAMAKAKNVPVIAYDRLIYSDDLAYYASFDGVAVGVAQGQYIAAHYQQYVTQNGNNNLIMIKGSNDDNNAHLFGQGAHQILDPLIASGALVNKYEQYTPGWDNPTAQTEMQAALALVHNKVAVAYVMNDGMAGTVIAALQQAGLAGKVLVTGQDAQASGIRSILLGQQSMTVYKPISKLADSVGQLVGEISTGSSTSALANQTGQEPERHRFGSVDSQRRGVR